MASPQIYSAGSTPTSAGSPANIAPAPQPLAMKPAPPHLNTLMSADSPIHSPISLGPTKEWVIPPRPKPGRKPATDTPPTKRKAQNRAAQRAFRERRAARVGELEEQLKEVEDERAKKEAAMIAELNDSRAQVTKLEAELRRNIDESLQWRHRYTQAEEMLALERKEKEALNVELVYLRNGAKSTGTNAVALPPRRNKGNKNSNVQPISTQRTQPASKEADPLGCGNCTSTGACSCIETAMTLATTGCGNCSTSRCECLEDTIKTADEVSFSSPNPAELEQFDLKRSLSSSPILMAKRPRRSVEEQAPQEIDFTGMFSSKPIVAPTQDYVTEYVTARPAPGEGCGFCDDSTYCACAEAAAAAARERQMENRLPPLMSEVTPPPSDTDVTSSESYKLPSLYPNHQLHTSSSSTQPQPAPKASKSCANGPGTCQQCQDDPRSGLFCRSLAAIRASDPSFSGCCGQGGPGGCCKDSKPSSSSAPSRPPLDRQNSNTMAGSSYGQPSSGSPGSTALSCADTYKTLASHRHFDKATDEISNWLPKLSTVAPRYPGRGAMDIDAASVMSVIKYFDVRFGRE